MLLLLLELKIVALWNLDKSVVVKKGISKMINCGKQDLTQFNIQY